MIGNTIQEILTVWKWHRVAGRLYQALLREGKIEFVSSEWEFKEKARLANERYLESRR